MIRPKNPDGSAMTIRQQLERREYRKSKRTEKRTSLPWSGNEKRPRSGSLYKWWAARLDALWGRAVRARDIATFGKICRIRKAKNCTGRAEVGYHLVSKARGHAIRWNLSAGVAACSRCNDGERMNRVLYDEYHRNLFGEELISELKRISHQTLKVGPEIMKDMAADFLRIEQHYISIKSTTLPPPIKRQEENALTVEPQGCRDGGIEDLGTDSPSDLEKP